jgi:hypothetical protein
MSESSRIARKEAAVPAGAPAEDETTHVAPASPNLPELDDSRRRLSDLARYLVKKEMFQSFFKALEDRGSCTYDDVLSRYIVTPSSDVCYSGLNPSISTGTRLGFDTSRAGKALEIDTCLSSHFDEVFPEGSVTIRGSHGKMLEAGTRSDVDVTVALNVLLPESAWAVEE